MPATSMTSLRLCGLAEAYLVLDASQQRRARSGDIQEIFVAECRHCHMKLGLVPIVVAIEHIMYKCTEWRNFASSFCSTEAFERYKYLVSQRNLHWYLNGCLLPPPRDGPDSKAYARTATEEQAAAFLIRLRDSTGKRNFESLLWWLAKIQEMQDTASGEFNMEEMLSILETVFDTLKKIGKKNLMRDFGQFVPIAARQENCVQDLLDLAGEDDPKLQEPTRMLIWNIEDEMLTGAETTFWRGGSLPEEFHRTTWLFDELQMFLHDEDPATGNLQRFMFQDADRAACKPLRSTQAIIRKQQPLRFELNILKAIMRRVPPQTAQKICKLLHLFRLGVVNLRCAHLQLQRHFPADLRPEWNALGAMVTKRETSRRRYSCFTTSSSQHDVQQLMIHGSYHRLPKEFPHPRVSGRNKQPRGVINQFYVSHPVEDQSVTHRQINSCQEELFETENQRYEIFRLVDQLEDGLKVLRRIEGEFEAGTKKPKGQIRWSKAVLSAIVSTFNEDDSMEILEELNTPTLDLDLVLPHLKERFQEKLSDLQSELRSKRNIFNRQDESNFHEAHDAQGHVYRNFDPKKIGAGQFAQQLTKAGGQSQTFSMTNIDARRKAWHYMQMHHEQKGAPGSTTELLNALADFFCIDRADADSAHDASATSSSADEKEIAQKRRKTGASSQKPEKIQGGQAMPLPLHTPPGAPKRVWFVTLEGYLCIRWFECVYHMVETTVRFIEYYKSKNITKDAAGDRAGGGKDKAVTQRRQREPKAYEGDLETEVWGLVEKVSRGQVDNDIFGDRIQAVFNRCHECYYLREFKRILMSAVRSVHTARNMTQVEKRSFRIDYETNQMVLNITKIDGVQDGRRIEL